MVFVCRINLLIIKNEVWIEKGTGGINQGATLRKKERKGSEDGRRVGDASRPL